MALILCSQCGGQFNIPGRTDAFSKCLGHRPSSQNIVALNKYRIISYDHPKCGEYGTAIDVLEGGNNGMIKLTLHANSPAILVHKSQVIEVMI